jgi:hypothetical protein
MHTRLHTCREHGRTPAPWPAIREKRAVGLGVPWYGMAVAWTAVVLQACVGMWPDTRLDRITSHLSQPPT